VTSKLYALGHVRQLFLGQSRFSVKPPVICLAVISHRCFFEENCERHRLKSSVKQAAFMPPI